MHRYNRHRQSFSWEGTQKVTEAKPLTSTITTATQTLKHPPKTTREKVTEAIHTHEDTAAATKAS
jgi:hypothetical protein